MRRLARAAGGVLLVAGVGIVLWVAVVWLWQDPFTYLYNRLQQDRLSDRYEDQRERLAGNLGPEASLRQLALEARRYRLALGVGDPVGRIGVPRLGLDAVVVNGTDAASLRKGPGRDLRTFMPGEGELVYIAGHRTTFGAPFSDIDALRAGDGITLDLPYARFEYSLVRHVIVPANDTARLRSHGREVLALQACHPRFFASHRYIAYARPIAATLPGGTRLALS